MAKTKTPKIDMAQLQEQLQRQFTNLDTKDPSLWPILPRILLCVFIAAAVAVALWYVKLTDYQAELEAERAKELTLREDYKKKLQKANESENKNIDAMNKAIREEERTIAEAKDKVTAKTAQIEQQKQNVADTQKKLDGIK